MSEERAHPNEPPEIHLPMVDPPDPTALAAEEEWLRELDSAPAPRRWFAFLRRGGPGYLQSALTLGGGTAASSLIAGGAFGYDLLWVAPVSMLLGVAVLSAVGYQTLSTGMRPLEAVRTHAGGFYALAFVLGAVLSSVIWHFAQYALASAAIHDIGAVSGGSISHGLGGTIVLAWAIVWSSSYGRSARWLRIFERSMQAMVWLIVICFAVVVARAGVRDPGALLAGFIPKVPDEFVPVADPTKSVEALGVVVAGLAAAVGANMIFLYPYSLLARGWGRAHRRLARFDLFAGMFVPYLLTTVLIVTAAANTFGPEGIPFPGRGFAPIDASRILGETFGSSLGRLLFDFGLLGMVTSSITLHMICCGFAASELYGWEVGSKRFRLACLLPTPGVLGAFFWGDMKIWIAVPTTILTGFLLPAVYIAFLKLQNSKEYLGDDRPRGARAVVWNGAIGLATVVLSGFLLWKAATALPTWWRGLVG